MIRFNVRETVGQYLSEMMKAELTNFLGRDRYVRGTGESNHRNGSYDRNFTLKGVGEVQVNVPRDRNGDFQTQVIPRSKQYEEEISRDLSLLFLSGVSTRSLSMISLRLLGRKISPTEISSANAELSEAIEKWRMRDLSRVLPPMLNGPILFDLVVPVKVAGLRDEGSTSPILGRFKGTARGGQKGTDYFWRLAAVTLQPPRWTFDVDDDGMMDHAVNGGCGNDRVTEIIAKLNEVDIRCNDC